MLRLFTTAQNDDPGAVGAYVEDRPGTGILRWSSRLVTVFVPDRCVTLCTGKTGSWRVSDRVADTQIGGVRKVTSGTCHANPTTTADLLSRGP